MAHITIKAWDNPQYMDRYTVQIGSSVYGMSKNPHSPRGFNQYAGEIQDLHGKFGKRVPWTMLPVAVVRAVLERLP
ncbi:MAG: hypothetical protein ACXABY_23005 [Candidatus Thorarchaeota archaeon]